MSCLRKHKLSEHNVSIHDRISHRSDEYFLDSFADHLLRVILQAHKGGDCKVHRPTFHSQGPGWFEDHSHNMCQDEEDQGPQRHFRLEMERLFSRHRLIVCTRQYHI